MAIFLISSLCVSFGIRHLPVRILPVKRYRFYAVFSRNIREPSSTT